MRWLRIIIFLALAAVAGLFGYAYFGDMDAQPQAMRVPVELDLNDASPDASPDATPAAAPAAMPAPAATSDATQAPAAASDDPDAALD